jgi:HEAT repeat protein
MVNKKACNILIVVVSLVLIVLFWNTTYALEETIAQQQADLKNVLETESLKVWRDYLEKYKPSREENDYTSLLSIKPDRLVMVPLNPDFALRVQEMLTATISPRPEPSTEDEKILLVSYSFAYGSSLWWGVFFISRPARPPAEFDLEFKLRVYLLNATDASLVAYPEHNYSGDTNKRDEGLEELFSKIQGIMAGGTPNLQEMIERACKEIHRIAKVVDGEEAGLEENIRRQIAKVGIQDENWKFRQRAAQALVGILKPDDIEILSKLLYDQDIDVRLAVVHGLSNKLTDSVTVDTLGAALVPLFRLALLDESSYVRRCAAEGLGKTNSPEALKPLFVALRDEDVSVRVATVESLGQLGDPKATDILIGLLQDKNSSVDSAAATSLEKLGWKPPDMRLQVKYLLAARKADDLVALGKPTMPLLIETLQSENIEQVKTAARALGKIGDQQSVGPLLSVLIHPDPGIQEVAAQALSEIGDVRAVIPLIALLREKNSNTRIAAVRALGDIGDGRAAEPLAELLKDTDKNVRKATIEVLKKLNWEPEDPEAKVRFLFLVGDTNSVVQMGKIAVEALMVVLSDESEERRVEAIRILGQIGKDAGIAVESICRFLQSESREERIAAASALATIGDTSTAEAIQKALQTQKELDEVSLWMRYALVQFGVQRDEHIKLLIDAVSSDLGDTAAEVISEIDLTDEDIELICKTLVSPDPETRKLVVKILASVGNSAIADRLWKALAEEDDEGVRKVIREVLRNM